MSFVAPPEFGDFIPKAVVPGRVRNTSIPNLTPIVVFHIEFHAPFNPFGGKRQASDLSY